jgi:hypothetical protein
MKITHALIAGTAGACAVTAIHQLVKRYNREAPRMDLLGMESLTKIIDKIGMNVPDDDTLYKLTLGGDLLSNSIYYAAVGAGDRKTWLKGLGLGLAAGIGAVALPKPLGLDQKHSNRTDETKILSVLYYLTGGLVASAVAKLLEPKPAKGLISKVKYISKNGL